MVYGVFGVDVYCGFYVWVVGSYDCYGMRCCGVVYDLFRSVGDW